MRASTFLTLLLVLPTASGCVAAGVAAGAYGVVKYDRNKLYRDFEYEFDELWVAMRAAVKDMGYAEAGILEHTDTEGVIQSGDLWARLEEFPEGFCGIWVRIGTFESEENTYRSNQFLNSIARQLDDESYR